MLEPRSKGCFAPLDWLSASFRSSQAVTTDIGVLPISGLETEAPKFISIIFVEVWGSDHFCAICKLHHIFHIQFVQTLRRTPSYLLNSASFYLEVAQASFLKIGSISKWNFYLQHFIIFNMRDEILLTKSGDWTSLCEDLNQKTVKMNTVLIIQEFLIPKTLTGESDTTERCSERVNAPIKTGNSTKWDI